MQVENFCYWLQGYFEINGVNGVNKLTFQQEVIVYNHVQLCMKCDSRVQPKTGTPRIINGVRQTTKVDAVGFVSNLNLLFKHNQPRNWVQLSKDLSQVFKHDIDYNNDLSLSTDEKTDLQATHDGISTEEVEALESMEEVMRC